MEERFFVFLFNEYDKIGLDEYFPIEAELECKCFKFFHAAHRRDIPRHY